MKILIMLLVVLAQSASADWQDVKDADDKRQRIYESPYTHDFQKEWADRDLEYEIDRYKYDQREETILDPYKIRCSLCEDEE